MDNELHKAGIDEAFQLAAKAHAGQKDLDGKPEILHPIAVALKGETEDEIICGALHDVVEDTHYTFEDLLAMGFSDQIVDTLRLLTHDKTKLSYIDYVHNICVSGNITAIRVKKNDLEHNLYRGHHSQASPDILNRLNRKHEQAYEMICEALNSAQSH